MRKILVLAAAAVTLLRAEPLTVKHVVVYYEAGRFAGWPANHGAWSWGDVGNVAVWAVGSVAGGLWLLSRGVDVARTLGRLHQR